VVVRVKEEKRREEERRSKRESLRRKKIQEETRETLCFSNDLRLWRVEK